VSSLHIDTPGVRDEVIAYIPDVIHAHNEKKHDCSLKDKSRAIQRLQAVVDDPNNAPTDPDGWKIVLKDLKRVLSCWRPESAVYTLKDNTYSPRPAHYTGKAFSE